MLALSLKDLPQLHRQDGLAAGWAVSTSPVSYPEAVAFMEARAQAIAEGAQGELVWLLEHPPLYTAGVSAKPDDLLDGTALPVFETGRGGQFTYHGPGQRVVYLMLDLNQRGRDVRAFVAALEGWLITALAGLGVEAGPREGRIGVWVEHEGADEKIAAIGVKLRRWVSFHGVSLNVAPNLAHFAGIVPCGQREHGVASLESLGRTHSLEIADAALKAAFETVFGAVTETEPPL
jgi:lipoyl(octanoyl) transferase